MTGQGSQQIWFFDINETTKFKSKYISNLTIGKYVYLGTPR